MAVDDVRARLRHRLEEMFGMDEAAILMDHPPGGWSDLATKADLDQRIDALERRFDLKLEALEHEVMGALHREIGGIQQELRAQTWRLTTAVLAAMSVLTAVFGLIVVVATR